jgi:adenylylsulfate kinase
VTVPGAGANTAEARRARNGHGSAVVWLTGLPAAGKSTIARAVQEALFQRRVQVYGLDGDELRRRLCRDLGFTEEDRRENIRRAAEVAALFADAGMVVVASFISPYRRDRAAARALAAPAPFLEVFVDCPLDECRRRDPRGLYQAAAAGRIASVTGVTAPYEIPEHPELHLRTDQLPVARSVALIVEQLERAAVLQPVP